MLKVNARLTSFVNGEMLKGSMSLDELDGKIKSLLKKRRPNHVAMRERP
jgi:hypothetical protein